MSVKVSPKYQVVIPENVRKALGIKPGMEIDVIAKGGIAYLVPVRPLHQVRERIAKYLEPQDSRTLRDKKDRKL